MREEKKVGKMTYLTTAEADVKWKKNLRPRSTCLSLAIYGQSPPPQHTLVELNVSRTRNFQA